MCGVRLSIPTLRAHSVYYRSVQTLCELLEGHFQGTVLGKEGRRSSRRHIPPGVRTRTPSSPSSETWFLVWELKTNQKTKKRFSSQCPTSYSCAKNQINRRINKRKPKFDTSTQGVCMSLSISETMRLPWEYISFWTEEREEEDFKSQNGQTTGHRGRQITRGRLVPAPAGRGLVPHPGAGLQSPTRHPRFGLASGRGADVPSRTRPFRPNLQGRERQGNQASFRVFVP